MAGLTKLEKLSRGLLKLVERCNSFILPGSSRPECHTFLVHSCQVGLIQPDVWKHLINYPDVFVISGSDELTSRKSLSIKDTFKTANERTAAVAKVLEDLRQKDVFLSLRGWRNETYDIRHTFAEVPLLAIERSGTGLFGTVEYGVHINGYCHKDGQLMMWVGRRSKTKQTYPGLLDNMCAGGLSSGLGVRECAIKECQEEASVPMEMFSGLHQTGCISYIYEDERGIFPECEFTFDMLLPETFIPVNADGEVDHFELMSMEKIKEMIIDEEFKPNSALVIMDFMIRHGLITTENEPNLCYLIEMMHIPLQKIYSTGSGF
ncbi:nudix hydrolase 24, chloroplastic-like [Pecten maximus]|uniref:nudix hydrolase 24, chloroplastic-like n=1 Tax=Pecten maximus TaxID=6579 RepID=UPI001458062A|nr:nudix hydrolase 24, chloroplastic-like [Pecten maximus]